MKTYWSNLNKKTVSIFLFVVLAVAAAIILFSVKPRTVQIRACLVLNPRFDSITDAQYSDILKRTKEICRKHFDTDLEYTKTDKRNIADYFGPYLNLIKSDKKVLSYRLPHNNKSIEKLAQSLIEENRATTPDQIIRAVNNQEGAELINLTDSKEGILRQVAALHINKLIHTKGIRCSDSKPLILDDFYNEFMSWDYISEHQNDFDLIITNQPIISAESYFPTIHSSMRGGITSGLGSRSPSTLGGMIIVSTFPMISTIDYFVKARGMNYDDITKIKTIAMLAGHELGHVLKYWGHEYEHPGCVMRPTPGLKYAEWANEINTNGPCKKRHAETYKAYFNSMRLK
jgi:hypothetical protein